MRKPLDSQADSVEDLKTALEKRDQVIEDLLHRVQVLEQEVKYLRAAAPQKVSAPADAGLESQATATRPVPLASQAPAPGPPTPPPPEERDEEESIAQAALERVLIQRSAILLPPWTLEVEPSLTYAHTSSDRVVIDGVAILDLFGVGLVVGDIVSERIRRDLLISALTFRLGLPWDSQIESRIPFRYETDSIVTADFAERSRQNYGLGDVEFAASHQLTREHGWVPDMVGSLRWRTTTGGTPSNDIDELPLGTGFHGLQFLLSGVKVSDPVAFFGGLSYTYNIADRLQEILIDPGDTWGFNLGAALALNPETSINFQWDHRFTSHTTATGRDIPGTALTVGTFRVGFTYALARNMFIDLGVGIGITDDAPAVQASVALPLRIEDIFRKHLFGETGQK